MLVHLHRIDALRREAELVDTSRARLDAATFLDGREAFFDTRRVAGFTRIPAAPEASAPPAFLFNTGFCGSTLLARMIGAASPALVLREPQALVDVASQAAALAAQGGAGAVADALHIAMQALRALAPDPGGLAIKPSCWANGLLPQMAARGEIGRALFMTMDRRAYCATAFYGGRERLEFCARLSPLIAAALPGGTARLNRAIAGESDPLRRIARVVVLLHAQQEHLFAQAARALGPGRCDWIVLEDIERDPGAVLARALSVLALPATDGGTDRALALTRNHAKLTGTRFSAERRAGELAANERLHGGRYDAALDWLARDWPEAIAPRRREPVSAASR